MISNAAALPAKLITSHPKAEEEASFYSISASHSVRPWRALGEGDTFAVLDSRGDIGASACGLFRDDTRYLSCFALEFEGMEPLLLGSNLTDDNAVLVVDLTNPDLYSGNDLVLAKDNVHVRRTVFISRGASYQHLRFRNYAEQALDIQFTINFDSDFADVFEVRGMKRGRRGVVGRAVEGPGRAILSYDGLDGKRRMTTLDFDPAPARLGLNRAAYALRLEPGEAKAFSVSINCQDSMPPKPLSFFRGLRAARRAPQILTEGVTTVETSNDVFNEMLCRSMADLYMLVTSTPQGPYPYAGIPWYSTTFGRDGLITALQMLWLDPSIARGVLKRLAAYQAKFDDSELDAQPGKILHEMRCGEMAALREIPFGLYYGSVDSTPLFALLVGLYYERTGDVETLKELWPAVEAALAWIDGPGDPDQDGFLEYERHTEDGLANQGWKDSYDAVFHADGRLARGRIALPEVQAYVFAAKSTLSGCARVLGRVELAERLRGEAKKLAQRFEEAFWCPEIGSYALALDGAKAPCRVRASNAGQVLFTGIAKAERAAMVADSLLRPQFFSGWGIRTVASGEARYNPMSYHNGSIWPHDNALIALGFARYGFRDALQRVFNGLFEAASYMDLRRLPELFCGFRRTRGRGPTLYPVACSPQAWASATPLTLLQASLGLEFRPWESKICLRNPCLPPFLHEVTLRNLRLGRSKLDIKVRRHRGDVSVEVLENRGKVQLSILHSL